MANTEKLDLSNKTCVVFDKGQFIHVAKRLGRDFSKVYYYLAEEKPYPQMQTDLIGRGFEEFEVVDDFNKAVKKADMVVFPDVYNGGIPEDLTSRGIPVFGALRSEEFETDRKKLRRMLELAGLFVPDAVFIKGLSKAQEYLKDKTDKYIKCSFYRGDFETYHYKNAFLASAWFRAKKSHLGIAAEEIELLIEDPIKSECEGGFDTYNLNGELASNPTVGYEAKGTGYVSCAVEKLPDIFQKMHDKMKPAFKKFGCQSAYSSEVRITADGKAYYIDGTLRFGSPPSEVQCEHFESFSEDVWNLAHGVLPKPRPAAKYGVQINLSSQWYEDYPLPVQFPKELDQWAKLKNARKVADGYELIPNDADGYMGAVVAIGDDLDATIKECIERAEQIECEDVDFEVSCFDKISKSIEAGEKYGIDFGR